MISKSGRREIKETLLLYSRPRVQVSGYDMGRHLTLFFQRHPETTVEQLAEKVCRSPVWIRMHLKLYKEVNERLSTMSYWELWRWTRTPIMLLKELMPASRKQSDEYHTTVENLDAAIPVASKSGLPAT